MDVDDDVLPTLNKMSVLLSEMETTIPPRLVKLNEDILATNYTVEQQIKFYASALAVILTATYCQRRCLGANIDKGLKQRLNKFQDYLHEKSELNFLVQSDKKKKISSKFAHKNLMSGDVCFLFQELKSVDEHISNLCSRLENSNLRVDGEKELDRLQTIISLSQKNTLLTLKESLLHSSLSPAGICKKLSDDTFKYKNWVPKDLHCPDDLTPHLSTPSNEQHIRETEPISNVNITLDGKESFMASLAFNWDPPRISLQVLDFLFQIQSDINGKIQFDDKQKHFLFQGRGDHPPNDVATSSKKELNELDEDDQLLENLLSDHGKEVLGNSVNNISLSKDKTQEVTTSSINIGSGRQVPLSINLLDIYAFSEYFTRWCKTSTNIALKNGDLDTVHTIHFQAYNAIDELVRYQLKQDYAMTPENEKGNFFSSPYKTCFFIRKALLFSADRIQIQESFYKYLYRLTGSCMLSSDNLNRCSDNTDTCKDADHLFAPQSVCHKEGYYDSLDIFYRSVDDAFGVLMQQLMADRRMRLERISSPHGEDTLIDETPFSEFVGISSKSDPSTLNEERSQNTDFSKNKKDYEVLYSMTSHSVQIRALIHTGLQIQWMLTIADILKSIGECDPLLPALPYETFPPSLVVDHSLNNSKKNITKSIHSLHRRLCFFYALINNIAEDALIHVFITEPLFRNENLFFKKTVSKSTEKQHFLQDTLLQETTSDSFPRLLLKLLFTVLQNEQGKDKIEWTYSSHIRILTTMQSLFYSIMLIRNLWECSTNTSSPSLFSQGSLEGVGLEGKPLFSLGAEGKRCHTSDIGTQNTFSEILINALSRASAIIDNERGTQNSEKLNWSVNVSDQKTLEENEKKTGCDQRKSSREKKEGNNQFPHQRLDGKKKEMGIATLEGMQHLQTVSLCAQLLLLFVESHSGENRAGDYFMPLPAFADSLLLLEAAAKLISSTNTRDKNKVSDTKGETVEYLNGTEYSQEGNQLSFGAVQLIATQYPWLLQPLVSILDHHHTTHFPTTSSSFDCPDRISSKHTHTVPFSSPPSLLDVNEYLATIAASEGALWFHANELHMKNLLPLFCTVQAYLDSSLERDPGIGESLFYHSEISDENKNSNTVNNVTVVEPDILSAFIYPLSLPVIDLLERKEKYVILRGTCEKTGLERVSSSSNSPVRPLAPVSSLNVGEPANDGTALSTHIEDVTTVSNICRSSLLGYSISSVADLSSILQLAFNGTAPPQESSDLSSILSQVRCLRSLTLASLQERASHQFPLGSKYVDKFSLKSIEFGASVSPTFVRRLFRDEQRVSTGMAEYFLKIKRNNLLRQAIEEILDGVSANPKREWDEENVDKVDCHVGELEGRENRTKETSLDNVVNGVEDEEKVSSTGKIEKGEIKEDNLEDELSAQYNYLYSELFQRCCRNLLGRPPLPLANIPNYYYCPVLKTRCGIAKKAPEDLAKSTEEKLSGGANLTSAIPTTGGTTATSVGPSDNSYPSSGATRAIPTQQQPAYSLDLMTAFERGTPSVFGTQPSRSLSTTFSPQGGGDRSGEGGSQADIPPPGRQSTTSGNPIINQSSRIEEDVDRRGVNGEEGSKKNDNIDKNKVNDLLKCNAPCLLSCGHVLSWEFCQMSGANQTNPRVFLRRGMLSDRIYCPYCGKDTKQGTTIPLIL